MQREQYKNDQVFYAGKPMMQSNLPNSNMKPPSSSKMYNNSNNVYNSNILSNNLEPKNVSRNSESDEDELSDSSSYSSYSQSRKYQPQQYQTSKTQPQSYLQQYQNSFSTQKESLQNYSEEQKVTSSKKISSNDASKQALLYAEKKKYMMENAKKQREERAGATDADSSQMQPNAPQRTAGNFTQLDDMPINSRHAIQARAKIVEEETPEHKYDSAIKSFISKESSKAPKRETIDQEIVAPEKRRVMSMQQFQQNQQQSRSEQPLEDKKKKSLLSLLHQEITVYNGKVIPKDKLSEMKKSETQPPMPFYKRKSNAQASIASKVPFEMQDLPTEVPKQKPQRSLSQSNQPQTIEKSRPQPKITYQEPPKDFDEMPIPAKGSMMTNFEATLSSNTAPNRPAPLARRQPKIESPIEVEREQTSSQPLDLEEEYKVISLTPCKHCGKKFATERIKVHENICMKAKNAPQKVFDSASQRKIVDAETGEVILDPTQIKPVQKEKENNPPKENNTKEPAWKKKSQQVQLGMQLFRAHKFNDVATAATIEQQLSLLQVDLRKTCPYCSRKFEPNVLERHEQHCRKSQMMKAAKSATSTSKPKSSNLKSSPMSTNNSRATNPSISANNTTRVTNSITNSTRPIANTSNMTQMKTLRR